VFRESRILFKECATLSASGFEVFLLAPVSENAIVEGVSVTALHVPRNRLGRITVGVFAALRNAWRLHADLYHFHDSELLPVAWLLQCLGNRVVFDMHENLPAAIRTKPWVPRLLRGVMSMAMCLVERCLLWHMPVVFAEESYLKHYRYVRRACVVQNMPLANRLLDIREPKNDQISVGYLGGVSADRGCLVTLQALALLKQRGRNVAWYCIGPMETGLREQVTAIVESHGLHDIHMMGSTPGKEALPLIARCHVGLALLSPCPNYIESFPTKMFEYMAMGLPVVVSDFPLYRRVIEQHQCGLCVNPADPQAVATALASILDDPRLAQQMGEAGRLAVVEQYNWSAEGRKLVDFYRTLI
jgi:glycosyltransferase involved in cell wall biosynthesis